MVHVHHHPGTTRPQQYALKWIQLLQLDTLNSSVTILIDRYQLLYFLPIVVMCSNYNANDSVFYMVVLQYVLNSLGAMGFLWMVFIPINDRLFQIVYGGILHKYLGSIINQPSTMARYIHPHPQRHGNGVATMELISQF